MKLGGQRSYSLRTNHRLRWPSSSPHRIPRKHSSAPAHPSGDQKPTKPDDLEAHYSCLERLEDDLRHAELGTEERCELADHVLRLRQRLSR